MPPPTEGAWGAAYPPVVSRPRGRTAALAVTGAVVLAGLGAGAWFLVPHDGGSPANTGARSSSALGEPLTSAGAGSPVTEGSTAPGDSAGPTATAPSTSPPTPSPGPSIVGTVTLAPATAGDATAPGIAAFLDQYFNSINTHDYQAYMALRSPQAQDITQSQFDTGYGSTSDGSETLRAISSADNGDVVARVTFTSHQSAAESANNSTCTAWTVSLYLVPNDSGYLIDNPPSDYHATDAACA